MLSLPSIFRIPTANTARILTFALIAPLAACGNTSFSNTTEAANSIATPSNAISPVAAAAPQGSYADVIARVSPAVVTIEATSKARAAQRNPLFDDPALREFFGGRIPEQQPRRSTGIGSGVVVSKDGFILTNNHVVEDAQTVKVTLNDKRTYTARVVGTDPASDLAVLKIEANDLPILPLADSDKVRVGDVALAVGNPLGIGQTVTSGIVSAKGRATGAGSGDSFEDFIQTDAPINRGNSGGALINANGELIGINSQILSPTGGSIGIGFAIPSNMAKNVMTQLIASGKVRRGYLGLLPQDITPDIAESLQLRDRNGVLIGDVTEGEPAARAGLRRGDVVIAVNNSPVSDANTFRNRIAAVQPGETVTLTIRRNNQEQQVRATLADRAEYLARTGRGERGTPDAPGAMTPEATATNKLGITLQPVTPETARQLSRFNVQPNTPGLVITEIDPNGAAADAGLRQGDIVQEINNQPVRSTNDVQASVERSQNRPVLMLIKRGENTLYVTVRPQEG